MGGCGNRKAVVLGVVLPREMAPGEISVRNNVRNLGKKADKVGIGLQALEEKHGIGEFDPGVVAEGKGRLHAAGDSVGRQGVLRPDANQAAALLVADSERKLLSVRVHVAKGFHVPSHPHAVVESVRGGLVEKANGEANVKAIFVGEDGVIGSAQGFGVGFVLGERGAIPGHVRSLVLVRELVQFISRDFPFGRLVDMVDDAANNPDVGDIALIEIAIRLVIWKKEKNLKKFGEKYWWGRRP